MRKTKDNSNYIDGFLRDGNYIHWQGQIYRIVSMDPENTSINVENIDSTELSVIYILNLLMDQEEGSAPIFAESLDALYAELRQRNPLPDIQPMGHLPENLLARADKVIRIVEDVQQILRENEVKARSQGVLFRRTIALRATLAQLDHPVGLTQYYEYEKKYRKHNGDRNAIATSFHRTTYHQTKQSAAVLHFVDIVILRFYAGRKLKFRPNTLYEKIIPSILERTGGMWLDPDKCVGNIPEDVVDQLLDSRIPMQVVLDNPEKAELLTPVKMPSRGWFYQYLRWFESQPEDGKDAFIERYGKEAWEHERMTFDTFISRAALPLQYVFADHWLIDIFNVDKATRSKVFRLWLTLLIDVYTRCIIGIALLYESPCIESIQIALRHAIWPKESHKKLGITEEWVCYGIPQELSLDNAWGHHSHSLENLARVISKNGQYNSIGLAFRPPYKGRYGALVERVFGNFSAQLKALFPDEAIHSSDVKHLRSARKNACLIYEDVYLAVHKLITRYQHTPHKGLGGMTPHEKWLESVQNAGLPKVPPLTQNTERLFWRLYPQTRGITRNGIAAFGMHYWSSKLASLPSVGQYDAKKKIQYSLRYQPNDIGRIALYLGDEWMGDVFAKELRLPDNTTFPFSSAQLQMAKELARQKGSTYRNSWLDYIAEAKDLEALRQEESRRAHEIQAPTTDSSDTFSSAQSAQEALEEAPLEEESTDDLADLLRDFSKSS